MFTFQASVVNMDELIIKLYDNKGPTNRKAHLWKFNKEVFYDLIVITCNFNLD